MFSWDGVSQDNLDIYVKLIASESQVRLTTDPNEDFSPVWSPDGRWIAFLRRESPERALLLLIPPIGGREKQLGEIRSPSSMFGRLAVWPGLQTASGWLRPAEVFLENL